MLLRQKSHQFSSENFDTKRNVCIIPTERQCGCEEDGKLLRLRRMVAQIRYTHIARAARVVEPELDMKRPTPRPSVVLENAYRLLRWLMPEGQSTGAPMRSVARELEEAFPRSEN